MPDTSLPDRQPGVWNLQRVCIVGAGAIGSWIGAWIAATGRAQVSALARGDTLHALRSEGWHLDLEDGSTLQCPVKASDAPQELDVQDLVVIAVKGPALAALARALTPLIGPHTVILPAMNGVPWWFCQGLPGFASGLTSIDPQGKISQSLPLPQVLGCVVHASSRMRQPGWVQPGKGRHLVIGEPLGGLSDRAAAVGQLLRHAGFEVTLSAQIRQDIWYKLWGNMTMNPVSALTGATIDRVLADPLVRAFCTSAMQEAAAIGERIGCPITQSPEDRHTVTAQLGAFKTSMLQDVESGRPIELDAIATAVWEIGQRLGMLTPHISALLGLTRLFGRTRGLYPETHA